MIEALLARRATAIALGDRGALVEIDAALRRLGYVPGDTENTASAAPLERRKPGRPRKIQS